jgi:transposase-like protein
MIAAEYRRHVDEGDPAPVSAIAGSHQVTVSAASRWVKGARERGLLDAE